MFEFISKYFSQFQLESLLTTLVNKLLSLLVLFFVFYLVKQVIGLVVTKIVVPSLKISTKELRRQKTISRLLESSLTYLLYFILLYSLLSILGLPVTSLFAGAGIAGVAIGLGAQGFLSDLLNGFFILLEHQFDVGDVVRLSNGPIAISGTVVSMGIRTSQVRDADGTLHFIPNRNILVVSNQSRGDMRTQVILPLKFTTDLDRVQQVIEAVHQKHLDRYDQITGVKILGPQNTATGQFSFVVQFFVQHGQQSMIYHRFYRLYQEALLEAGIDLPTAELPALHSL